MMCEKMLEPSSVTFLYSFTQLGTPWSKIIKWNMRQLLAESISQAWWNVKPFSIPPFTISLSRDSKERDKRSGGEKLLVYKKTDNHPFWMNINCASSFLNNRLGCVFLFLRKKIYTLNPHNNDDAHRIFFSFLNKVNAYEWKGENRSQLVSRHSISKTFNVTQARCF